MVKYTAVECTTGELVGTVKITNTNETSVWSSHQIKGYLLVACFSFLLVEMKWNLIRSSSSSNTVIVVIL